MEVVLVFFDISGLVHHEFLCQGQTDLLVMSGSAETS